MNMQLQRFLPRPEALMQEFTHPYDPLDPKRPVSRPEQIHRFISASNALYWQAERSRARGISWRNFCVGCAVWAFREDASWAPDRWRYFYGMNTKVEENSRNICAEPIALNAALGFACTEVVGLIVVGNPREQDSSMTLRPCEHCRLLMKSHPLVKLDTIVVCALPPSEQTESLNDIGHEAFTFEELLREYGEL